MAETPEEILAKLTNQLVSHLQLEAVISDQPVPAVPRTVSPAVAKKTIIPKPAPVKIIPAKAPATVVSSDKVNALEELKKIALVCTKCKLSNTRTQVVFGVGNPHAKLLFVGEAPGHDEDVQGIPFVGRAGQLLTQMIEAPRSLDMKREDVYICNVIKCRPPENRNPEPDEINCCEDYLLKQLDIIQPTVICTLGKFAAQTLLRTETPISKLRGNWYEYHGIPLMPTFHPAALLRNQAWKKDAWADFLLVKEKLNSL